MTLQAWVCPQQSTNQSPEFCGCRESRLWIHSCCNQPLEDEINDILPVHVTKGNASLETEVWHDLLQTIASEHSLQILNLHKAVSSRHNAQCLQTNLVEARRIVCMSELC